MKKVISLMIVLTMLSTVAFADVVGPVGGINGLLGVTYMHGRGTYLEPINLIIILGIMWLFLFIICATLCFVIFKISKRKVFMLIPIVLTLLIGIIISLLCILSVAEYMA